MDQKEGESCYGWKWHDSSFKQLSVAFDISSLLRYTMLDETLKNFLCFPLPFHSPLSDFRNYNRKGTEKTPDLTSGELRTIYRVFYGEEDSGVFYPKATGPAF